MALPTLESPTVSSKGKSLKRSLNARKTAAAVAWKYEPCGRESNAAAPELIIAPAESESTCASSKIVWNVCYAIVAPAVVEPVAPVRRKPDKGASMNVGICNAAKSATTSP